MPSAPHRPRCPPGRRSHSLRSSKYGKMIGQDEYGNQYFENLDELPYRNRWVKYRLVRSLLLFC